MPARRREFRRVVANRAPISLSTKAPANSSRLQAHSQHLEFFLRGHACRVVFVSGSVRGEIDGKLIVSGFDQAQIAHQLIKSVQLMPPARSEAAPSGDQQLEPNATNGAA